MTSSKRVLSQLWFLTAIAVDESTMIRHSCGEVKVETDTRTFGYEYGFNYAVEAVRENRGNMHEGWYNYLVIERIGVGVHALADEEKWFKWNGRRWVNSKKPIWSMGRINWAIG